MRDRAVASALVQEAAAQVLRSGQPPARSQRQEAAHQASRLALDRPRRLQEGPRHSVSVPRRLRLRHLRRPDQVSRLGRAELPAARSRQVGVLRLERARAALTKRRRTARCQRRKMAEQRARMQTEMQQRKRQRGGRRTRRWQGRAGYLRPSSGRRRRWTWALSRQGQKRSTRRTSRSAAIARTHQSLLKVAKTQTVDKFLYRNCSSQSLGSGDAQSA
mmetsp:Transcript_45244/g.142423  ORF Transcript_45244/g.142423 Transcript_45244/m.142423 type:complete len:218 (+) Transcript_45244:585-1238(+)